MPTPINEGLVTRGLAGLFGLKGRFRLQLDETEVPVVITSQLDRSPFQLTKPCGAGTTTGAVVAENAYVSVSPSTGVILCIDRIDVPNNSSGLITVQRLTVANLVTLGAPSAIIQLRDFNNIEPPQANGPRTSSVMERYSFAGALGDTIWEGNLAAGVLHQIFFPDGYFLYGDDPAGIGGLAVVGGVTNNLLRASFTCREFRLPG